MIISSSIQTDAPNRWSKGGSVRKLLLSSLLTTLMLFPWRADAQAPAASTSQEVLFKFDSTHLPYGSTQTITAQVWDAATGGNLIFSEVHPNVKIGTGGELDFLLGSLTQG